MNISPPTEQEAEDNFGLSRDRLGRRVWKNPVLLVVTGFGAGLTPYAPGTAGTLVAIPIYLFIAPLSPTIYVGVVLLLFALGVAMCRQAERQLAIYDHPAVVWDEIVGYLVAMFLVPVHWVWVVVGFVLFRLFDIWKPFPIRILERRVRGGLGTMLDDVVAGSYAWLVLQGSLLLTTQLS
jgi:phosphatidylglycerophosphatase A